MVFGLLAVLAVSPGPGAKFFSAEGESAVRLVYGLDLAGADREATVRSFLAENAGAFGLAPEDELQLISATDVLTFERRRAGIAVLGSEVRATFDARGHLAMVHLGSPVPASRGSFLVEGAWAERAAAAGLDGVQLVESRRFWLSDGVTLRPAWLVRFSARGEPFRALVDAENGRRIDRVSEKLNAGMGSVYDVSPAKGPVVTRALGGLTNPANGSTLNGARAIGRSCDGAGIGAGCTSKATANASGDWTQYTPSFGVNNTDRFGEVNAYYASDRFIAWARGLSPSLSMPVIDVFTNVGNSNQGFFLGSSPLGGGRFGIELGQGPQADWAYEGDVIFHELGHGVVQQTSGFGFYRSDQYGTYGEGGALNEGSADCMAFGITNDPVLAEFMGPHLQDAGSILNPYLRRVDAPITCHGYDGSLDGGNPGRFGEIHDDGRIIGSFFWALHSRTQSLGADAASRAYLRALSSVGSNASFHDVALAVQDQMRTLYGDAGETLARCLQCELDIPGCDSRTRRIYSGEIHESRLLGNDTPASGSPSTFQYELAVPANALVNITAFQITSGQLPDVYARFNNKVTWSGGTPTYDFTFNTTGASLPMQTAAGTWYLQGRLRDPGNGTRRYGIRATIVGGGPSRPPGPSVTCSLGSGTGPCACVPQCVPGNCGDGCGGQCVTCDAGTLCSGGTCVCIPQCSGKACGPDGCGGVCGACASGFCDAGTCSGCTPMCAGKMCGSNGCGQSCGQCTENNVICDLPSGLCVDAGMLPMNDGGAGGGGEGGGAGGGGEVVGGCNCSTTPLLSVLGALLLLCFVKRRRAA